MKSKNNKDPINIYIANALSDASVQDWSFMYPKPKTLFSDLLTNKNKTKDTSSYLVCPAVASKFKKTLVFKNSVNASYEYGSNNGSYYIVPKTKEYIHAECMRDAIINKQPTFLFSLNYLFFSEEPLKMSATAPYFHKPEYTKNGSVIPGVFDIGQWFRPYNFEVQMWEESGEFSIKDGEPLFYIEFETDRKINLKRFNLTEKIKRMSEANVSSINLFGPFQPLSEKYKKFKEVGYREKILTEIKNNLIEEDPYQF
jgi:hypothetical protein